MARLIAMSAAWHREWRRWVKPMRELLIEVDRLLASLLMPSVKRIHPTARRSAAASRTLRGRKGAVEFAGRLQSVTRPGGQLS